MEATVNLHIVLYLDVGMVKRLQAAPCSVSVILRGIDGAFYFQPNGIWV